MIKTFLLSLPFIVALDISWVGFFAKKLYLNGLRSFLKLNPDGSLAPLVLPAIFIYLLIALGIAVFVVPLASGIPLKGLFYGASLGLVIYGVYEFTNWSLFANWPVKIVAIDTVWGMVLCGITSMAVVYLQKYF